MSSYEEYKAGCNRDIRLDPEWQRKRSRMNDENRRPSEDVFKTKSQDFRDHKEFVLPRQSTSRYPRPLSSNSGISNCKTAPSNLPDPKKAKCFFNHGNLNLPSDRPQSFPKKETSSGKFKISGLNPL